MRTPSLSSARLEGLQRFYSILARLEDKLGGRRTLQNCAGQVRWPRLGVYFFYEQGEQRSDSGIGPRVVRVGTHALGTGSGTKLWTRLSQHRGQVGTGGGNHRGSIFRLIIGTALIEKEGYECATWGNKSSAPREIRERELELERAVSGVIRAMPFLWLAVEDKPGPQSLRGYIERNAIALLSNYGRPPLDPPSDNWLGRWCDRERVRNSGLWNSNHVDETFDPAFLVSLEELVHDMGAVR
jgi:hypothetical protein